MSDAEPTTHKERLMTVGAELMSLCGYNGTSVDSILAESKVPKGSFYHHFGSKRAFAAAIIQKHDELRATQLDHWSRREDLTSTEKITGYYQEIMADLVASGWVTTGLSGKLSNELSANSESFRLQLDDSFETWARALTSILDTGQKRGEIRTDVSPTELAELVIILVEGSFATAVAVRDREAFDAATLAIIDLLRSDRT